MTAERTRPDGLVEIEGLDELDGVSLERTLAARGAKLGTPLTVRALTTSTNDDARTAARAGAPAGAAFAADAQSQGRGRLGRLWHSPPRTNLYVSFLLRPALATDALVWLPLAAGLAVADAVGPHLDRAQRLSVKWPNDVLLDGHKLAGVLSEAEVVDGAARFVIVGIGINVHEREFPEELAHRATSLVRSGITGVERGALLVDLCLALARRVDALEQSHLAELRADLARLDALAGKTVAIGGVRGRAAGIDPEGRLRVVDDDGVELAFASGEAQLEPSDRDHSSAIPRR